MGTSDNFEALKAVESLGSASLLAVQDGGYKRKATVAELATSMTLAITGSKLLALSTDSVTDNADGTADVTLTFTLGGAALTRPIAGTLMICNEAVGLAAVALGNSLAAVKGQVAPIVSTSVYHFLTNATGELDLTLDEGLADSFWLVVTNTDGTHLISDEIAITVP
jgi:hypothetical protein